MRTPSPQSQPQPPPDVLIVGVGAMACLFAARLSAVGVRVGMLGHWAEALDALQSRGVLLEAGEPPFPAYPVWASSNPQDFLGVRAALVLVKSWQTGQAAAHLAACLHPDGLAVSLQNGLGNRETLASSLGENRVSVGAATYGATLLAPGRVRPAGEGVVTLEPPPSSPGDAPKSTRLGWLAEHLALAGFMVERPAAGSAVTIEGLLWSKLVINAAINPLSALLGVRNGELLERPQAHALLRGLAQEAASAAAARGLALRFPDPAAAAEEVARRTAQNLSSMLQDIQRGAPTELESISGAILRAAESAGLNLPLTRSVYTLLKTVE